MTAFESLLRPPGTSDPDPVGRRAAHVSSPALAIGGARAVEGVISCELAAADLPERFCGARGDLPRPRPLVPGASATGVKITSVRSALPPRRRTASPALALDSGLPRDVTLAIAAAGTPASPRQTPPAGLLRSRPSSEKPGPRRDTRRACEPFALATPERRTQDESRSWGILGGLTTYGHFLQRVGAPTNQIHLPPIARAGGGTVPAPGLPLVVTGAGAELFGPLGGPPSAPFAMVRGLTAVRPFDSDGSDQENRYAA